MGRLNYIQGIILILGLVFSINTNGQKEIKDTKKSKIHLRADLIHQDNLFTLDFGALGVYDKVTLRPGISLSLEYDWINKKFFRFYSSVKTGFQNNPYEERFVTIGSNTGIEFLAFKRLLIAPRGGLDYNFVKPTDIRYEYDGDKWVVSKNLDPVFSRITASVGLDLGYRIRKGYKPIDLLINGTATIGGPYIKDSVPIWAWKSLGLGLRMTI